MKILITSDQHWYEFKEFDKLTEDGRSFRLSLYEKTHEFIRNYCGKHGIIHWIDAGDMFHSRESVSLPVLDALGKQLQKSKDVGIKMWFVKGNHDINNRVGSITSLNILSEYGNVINDRCICPLEGLESPTVHFIPWDQEINFEEVINRCAKTNLVIAHRMINGAETNKIILNGESIDNIDFEKFDYAFIGHVHKRQKINSNMMYVGNLLNSNFGEKTRGGFLIYDTDSKNVEVVENPFSPVFIKQDIRRIEDANFDVTPIAFYDLKIIAESTSEIEKITQELLKKKDQFAGIRISAMKHLVIENRIDESQLLTPEILLQKYADLNKLDENILSIGKEILEGSKGVG